MNPDEYFSVHLDLKLLLSFFGGLHGHFNKLLMSESFLSMAPSFTNDSAF